MDIKDFQGLTKFKILIPTIYVISWLSMILGPSLFEKIYVRFCVFFIVYTDLKILMLLSIMVVVLVKSRRVFRKLEQNKNMVTVPDYKEGLDVTQQIYYGFILPSYKQEIEMIAQTLDLLASHKRAKERYLIFLAMEAHEQGCQAKAEELIERFREKFRVITYTRHEVKPNQQKGKASNVSWCAQHLEPIFKQHMIDPDTVFLTIIDADSWAPDLYFDILEEEIIKNYEKRYTIMFQPPQIFTRNNLDVPVTTRVYDLMHAFLHCSNLFSMFGFTFPISNYSVSYNLMKRIGFWDTCADAIGEDFHTAQKAYWKTEGEFRTVPIYVPFNQVNISTGQGYVEDVLARFWQAERHAQGCADLAWSIKMLLKTKFRPLNLIVFLQVFETFTLPGVLPWIFISLMLQSHVLYFSGSPPPEIISPLVLTILFNIMSVGSTVGYFLFQFFKRKSNRLIYHKENEGLWRVIQYPIIFTVNLFAISVPTFVIAAFMVLVGKREYVTALKKNTSKNQNVGKTPA